MERSSTLQHAGQKDSDPSGASSYHLASEPINSTLSIESVSLSSALVSSLGSQEESPPLISTPEEGAENILPDPAAITPPLAFQDIHHRTRQPLPETSTERVNHVMITNIRDLYNIERALKCRLITQAEYEYLREQREDIFDTDCNQPHNAPEEEEDVILYVLVSNLLDSAAGEIEESDNDSSLRGDLQEN